LNHYCENGLKCSGIFFLFYDLLLFYVTQEKSSAMSLGLGAVAVAIIAPLVCTGAFIGTRKRLRLQWREELMDPQGGIYSTPTAADISKYFRKVRAVEDFHTNAYQPAGGAMDRADAFGVTVVEQMFSPDETQALLEDAVDWANLYGQPLEMKMASHAEQVCTPSGAEEFISSLKTSEARTAVQSILATLKKKIAAKRGEHGTGLFEENRVVSDHAVDARLMKAPWGCGDAMAMDKLPLTLRWALKRIEKQCPKIGKLRHVFLEYSPNGVFCRAPSCPPGFDGHDYVIIPLTKRATSPTVVTFSPLLRSRHAHSVETLVNSWTSRDVDVLVPGGGALRVVGEARYMWGWGIRPFQWFGGCGNTVERILPDYSSPQDKSNTWISNLSSCWSGLCRRFGASSDFVAASPADGDKASAILVLHFEGPRSSDKQRSRWAHPEMLVFGYPPTPDEFEHWAKDDRPTQADVYGDYVLFFMIKNYLQMLVVS
jgi:hypothetical protein